MTKKQYIKENFYDEYAIKKEDTIIAIVDSGTNARKICNELNALAEENEQLQKDCTTLIYHNQEYRKENEQLKQQEKKLYKYFRKCFDNVSEQGFRETWEVVKKYD